MLIYHKIKKKWFFQKNHHFLIESVLQRGEIWFNRDTLVPSPHYYSLQTHKFNFWILEHKIFTYILLDYLKPSSQAKCKWKFYVPEFKNQICGFVGNVDADSGLTCYPHWTRSRPSKGDFRSKNHWFFWIFDKSAGSVDNKKLLGKVVYKLSWTESII